MNSKIEKAFAEIQKELNTMTLPKLSPVKLEYYKAGARAVIEKVNKAIKRNS